MLQPRCLHTLFPFNSHPRCLYAVMIHRRHPHMLFVTVSISLLMTELSRELICAGGGARQEIDPHRLVGRRDRDHRVDRVHQGRCAASRTVKLTPSSRPHPATPPLPFPSPSPTPGVCFAVQKRARIAPSPRVLQPTLSRDTEKTTSPHLLLRRSKSQGTIP